MNYTQQLIRVLALNKYKAFISECKESAKGIAGDKWALGATKDVTMDQFWNWKNIDGVDASGYL